MNWATLPKARIFYFISFLNRLHLILVPDDATTCHIVVLRHTGMTRDMQETAFAWTHRVGPQASPICVSWLTHLSLRLHGPSRGPGQMGWLGGPDVSVFPSCRPFKDEAGPNGQA